jgi:hypothetical protein
MRIKTVSVEYQRKLNLGDYNSATLGITLWADLDSTDDPAASVNTLQETAREHVKAECYRLKGRPAPVAAATPAFPNGD